MEFYKVACRYLKLCDVKFSEPFLRLRIQSHPDYPSLVSFTDTLDEIKLSYTAVIVDKERYKELKYPLLAHVKLQKREDFTVVTSPTDFEVNNYSLLHQWNGIAMMIEKKSAIHDRGHNEWLEQQATQQKQWLVSMVGFLLVVAFICMYRFNATTTILTFLSLVGVFVSGLIVMYGMGKKNAISEQLCSADGSQGCDKILHSKVATFWKGFGLGDLGLVYFSCLSIFLMLSNLAQSTVAAYSFLLIPFSISILVAILSIFYQWRIAKSWCKMCLFIVGVLLLQSGWLFYSQARYFIIEFQVREFALFLFSFIIPLIGLVLIKPIISKADSLLIKEIGLLKLKRNIDIFSLLLKRGKKLTALSVKNDIFYGRRDAPIQITVACNPFCSPCAGAHEELDELLELYPDKVGISTKFVIESSSTKNRRTIAADYIIQAYKNAEAMHEPSATSPLTYWFKHMDISLFTKEYKLEYQHIKNESELRAHEDWSNANTITRTPTIFINGYELPAIYSISSLKLLINSLDENIIAPTVVANAE